MIDIKQLTDKNVLRVLMRQSNITVYSLVAILCLSSCSDVIFYKIKNEVKLEDANVAGEIHSIIRFENDSGDYIYTDNGQVRFKEANSTSNNDWSRHMTGLTALEYDYYGSKFDGVQIIKVACDSDNVYALGMEWEVDDDEGENVPKSWNVYTSKGPDTPWKKIWTLNANDYSMKKKYLRYHGIATIFCTNTYDKANRSAYIRTCTPNKQNSDNDDIKIYLLDGENTPAEFTGYVNVSGKALMEYTHDAVYFNGSVYVLNDSSDDSAIGTDEEPGAAATHIYYTSNNTLYYSSDGTTWQSINPGTSGGIISMAVTKDYFLLGTDGSGLYKVRNVDGVPTGKTVDFSTNADTALSSPYVIRAMYCTDSAKNETDATIYVTADFSGSRGNSTGSMDDVGLWSYYPGRGNWNRE